MKKFLLLILLGSVVAGCTPLHPSGCHKTTALGSCDSGRFTDQDEYGKQARAIKHAIESRLADRSEWKGKKCRLHMEFAYDGKLNNIETREGNKAYCAALKTAAQRATFPAFPSQRVYQAFESSRFVMVGE
ncbi:tolA family protein [Kosakonia sacchari]|uniref:cell envelope integrity TolA C-terminal domain-containing protein n=1 Tax=Kosakonia sacchari TaxID=1158459 RepID=UPI002ACE900C|nr:cell envelope integrity TolA C-terminal domain-containing protein [Kosakonia sacchari]MDZ7324473.1 tolA family protein [Kosakonia sacchari]